MSGRFTVTLAIFDDGMDQVDSQFGFDPASRRHKSVGPMPSALLADGLGSVRLEMVGSAVEATTTYSPYGKELAQEGDGGTVNGFTGEQEDNSTGLLYLRARYYSSGLMAFLTRDPWPGQPRMPQTMNGWSYVEGNPVGYNDSSGRRRCSSIDGACNPIILPPLVHARVYYLNAIGNETGSQFSANSDPSGQGYFIYMAERAVGGGNVQHIPIFAGSVFHTRIEMGLEMLDLRSHWTEVAANAIIQDVHDHPLAPGEQLIILGESGGGTIAIEALELLKKEGIYVDQVILRGSPVTELFDNVGRIDYITSRFDYYYSFFIDFNTCGDPTFFQHVVDFWGHKLRQKDTISEIGRLIFDLIIAGEND